MKNGLNLNQVNERGYKMIIAKSSFAIVKAKTLTKLTKKMKDAAIKEFGHISTYDNYFKISMEEK